MALKPVHDFCAAKSDALHVFAFAQMFARAPQRLAARAVIDVAIFVVAVVERDTAERSVMLFSKTDRVFLRLRGPAAFLFVPGKAHHKCLLRRRELCVIVAA